MPCPMASGSGGLLSGASRPGWDRGERDVPQGQAGAAHVPTDSPEGRGSGGQRRGQMRHLLRQQQRDLG